MADENATSEAKLQAAQNGYLKRSAACAEAHAVMADENATSEAKLQAA
jgi:hypothetical protein